MIDKCKGVTTLHYSSIDSGPKRIIHPENEGTIDLNDDTSMMSFPTGPFQLKGYDSNRTGKDSIVNYQDVSDLSQFQPLDSA